MSEKNVDMNLYVSTDPDRASIGVPFRQGEYMYATDGRIMIRRQATVDDPCEDDHRAAPKVAYLFAHIDELDMKPLAIDFLLYPRTCPECEGIKVKMKDCLNCDGVGREFCHACEHSHPCPECDEKGYIPSSIPCDYCLGNGDVEEPIDIKLDDQWFAGKYLWLLCNKQAPETIQVSVIMSSSGYYAKLLFRNAQYEGLLLGLREPVFHSSVCPLSGELEG